jgi:hypothetical protein
MFSLRWVFEVLSPILPKKCDTRLKSAYFCAITWPFVALYAFSPILLLLLIFGGLTGAKGGGSLTLEDLKVVFLMLMSGGALIGFIGHDDGRS